MLSSNEEQDTESLKYQEEIDGLRGRNIILIDLYDTLIGYPLKLPKKLKEQYNAGNISKASIKYLNNVAQTRDSDIEIVNKLHGIIPADKDDAISALQEYTAGNVNNTKIYENDTQNLLERIKNHDYKIGVVSNLGKEYISPFMTLFPEGLFNYEIFSCKIGAKKPDKDVFNYLLKEINLGKKDKDKISEVEAKNRMIMVGNKINEDIAFAKNLGIPGILMDRNAEKMNYDKKRNLITIHTLYDLLDILGIDY